MYSRYLVRVGNQNLKCLRHIVSNRILIWEEAWSQIKPQLIKRNHTDKLLYELTVPKPSGL